MPRPAAKCGTQSGYTAHRRKKEEACRACKDAIAEIQPERAMIRREAVAELIRRHSVEYDRIRAEVVARRAADREWAAVLAEVPDA